MAGESTRFLGDCIVWCLSPLLQQSTQGKKEEEEEEGGLWRCTVQVRAVPAGSWVALGEMLQDKNSVGKDTESGSQEGHPSQLMLS